MKQKKINQDQKAQLQKKPQIEAQLKQLQEQQKNFEEFAKELETKHDKEKASLQETHEAELQKAKDAATQQHTETSTTQVGDAIRTTCQFLHAVALSRSNDSLPAEELSAYEAVLNHLYQGNQIAIDTLTNLVEGSEDKITDATSDDTIEFTFAQLKASAEKAPSAISANIEDDEEDTKDTSATPAVQEVPEVDQTIANAGLTELEDTTALPNTNEAATAIPEAAPEQVSTTGDAANAVAEASWAPEQPLSASQTGEDWVQVPRDPAETETPHAPAPNTSGSNWADEVTVAAEEQGPTPVIAENDGFSEVRRERGGRGGGRGRGEFRSRGRGGRGEYRGQRGRGRGGQSRG